MNRNRHPAERVHRFRQVLDTQNQKNTTDNGLEWANTDYGNYLAQSINSFSLTASLIAVTVKAYFNYMSWDPNIMEIS